jgi:hypothetical protein
MTENRESKVRIDAEIAEAYGVMADLSRKLWTLSARICDAAKCRGVEYARSAFIAGEIGKQGSLYHKFYSSWFEQYDAMRIALDEAQAEYQSRNANYGGWSRFFLVRGGHIHSSLSCPTCNRNGSMTIFQWLTDLSGLTEGDAVAEYGAVLCTVCFPSAPVEYTNGK